MVKVVLGRGWFSVSEEGGGCGGGGLGQWWWCGLMKKKIWSNWGNWFAEKIWWWCD